MADYVEEKPEAPAKARGSVERWIKEISSGIKFTEKWHNQGKMINERFLDIRDAGDEDVSKYNLFTSNVGILISTLYARFPTPMVVREFEDQDDDVARVAGTILERLLKIKERDDYDTATKKAVQDRLVPGAGFNWFRYEPKFEPGITPEITDPEGNVLVPATQFERIVDEEVITDYVFWKDIIWSPCRTWEDCRWIARRVKMTKKDAKKRFGAAKAEKLAYARGNPTSTSGSASDDPGSEAVRYCEIWELWSKAENCRYWLSKGVDEMLDEREVDFRLPKFWPCSRPLFALMSTTKMVPRPDYLLVQDQYKELDDVNNRISILVSALKVVGFFDQTNAELNSALESGANNRMIPVRNWSAFSDKGGMKGSVDWLPLDMVVATLDKLRQMRQEIVAQIYELTGISDIMRGATRATETATAQQLKAQYGSVKLQFLQLEVASFIQDGLNVKAEMIRNCFQPETIIERSNIMRTPDAPLAQQAVELLQSPMFKYRVEIYADSMAVPEFNAERDARMDYIRAVSEFLMSAQGIIQVAPQASTGLLKILQWGAAGFRVGRGIETVLDEMIKTVEKSLANPPPPPPPNPKDVAQAKNFDAQAQKHLADIQKGTSESQRNMAQAQKDVAQAQNISFDTLMNKMEVENPGSTPNQAPPPPEPPQARH